MIVGLKFSPTPFSISHVEQIAILYPVDELEKPSITMTPLEGEAKRKEIDEQLNMQYSGILILCCFIIMMSFLLSFYFRSGASKTVISGMIYGGLATVIISMGVYSGELNPFAQLLICGLVLGVLIVIPFVFPHVLTSATKNQYDRERES